MDNEIMQVIYKLLGKDKLIQLYDNLSSTLITYRVIPPTSRQILLKLINIVDDINNNSQFISENICISSNKQEIDKISGSYKILVSLKIFTETTITTDNITEKKYMINTNFKSNMLNILSNGFESKIFPICPSAKVKNIKELFVKGQQKLDKFLEQIISLENFQCLDQETDLIKFLLNKNLIKKENNSYKLTGNCLTLLLENRQTQLRGILYRYLDYFNKSKSNNESIEFAMILFECACLEPGLSYKIPSTFSDSLLDSFCILNYLGLVSYNLNKKTFITTPLFGTLFESNTKMQLQEKLFYIETNFRVYVYSSNVSNLLIFAIIKFLVDILFEFEDFTVTEITRRKIREAFRRGLSAAQIIKFINNHSKNGIPSNVEQQIIIWEQEKNAIQAEKCNYYYEFLNQEEYLDFIRKCTAGKINIIWRNNEEMKVCIPKKHEQEIKLMH